MRFILLPHRYLTPKPKCEYCFRLGHTTVVCDSRFADHRQELMNRRLLIESRGKKRHPHPQQPFQAPSNPPAGNQNHDNTSPGTSLHGRTDTNVSRPATTITSHANARRGSTHFITNLTVVSVNVRGLRTNLGTDNFGTHNVVLLHRADDVTMTEIWLNYEVEPTFGKILS